MKKLHFLYRMRLEFDRPVSEHYYTLRFVPVSDSVQKITVEHCQVDPVEGSGWQSDGFGNKMFVGDAREEHTHFSYEVSGTAHVDRQAIEPEGLNAVFRYESPLTKADEAIKQLYGKLCPWENDASQRAVSMMHGLHERFSYVPGSTGIHTTAAEAWEKRSGVCQDYAHILISLCRLDHIPARYVAGLMLGEGASHAWVEIYADGCWVGLDPTNDQLVNDDYIKICHGRDYGDCAVDRGVFRGSALQTQNVYVKVEEL